MRIKKCRVPQVIPIPPSQPQHRSQGARTATARGFRHLRAQGGDFRGGFRGKGHCPGEMEDMEFFDMNIFGKLI